MKDSSYIQYGCGMSAADGWRNFDASPTLRFERLPVIGNIYTKNKSRFPVNVEYGDIVKGLPISPSESEAIYCSHVLEHLSLNDLRVALENTFSVLKKGGIFRLVVPDLEFFISQYVNNQSAEAASIFLRDTSLGYEQRRKGLAGFFVDWLGNSHHLWMWDYKSLEHQLSVAGFMGVRRAECGDSRNEMFEQVENPRRWANCLGIECVKI